jgi:hypothetical protein
MITITFTALTVRATLWSVTVIPPMASSCIAAVVVATLYIRS